MGFKESLLNMNKGTRVDKVNEPAATESGEGETRELPRIGDAQGCREGDVQSFAAFLTANRGRVAAGAVAVVLAGTLGFGAWCFSTQPLTDAPVTESSGSVPVRGSEPVAAVAEETIVEAVSSLEFAGEDVSVPKEDVEVTVRNDRVMVKQTLRDTSDPASVVDGTAKRSAALATSLEGTEIQIATWVAVDDGGNVKVAVEQTPGKAPQEGSTGDILAGSDGYVISDDVYEGMGGEASGIAQTGGETPTDPDGAQIVAGQTPPEQPEDGSEPESQQPQSGSETGGQSGTDGGSAEPAGSSGGSSGSSGSPSGGSAQQGSGGASQQGGSTSKPAHTHSWKEVYRTEPVYGTQQVWVPDVEYVRHAQCTCNGCGAVFGSVSEWEAHDIAMIKQGDGSHGSYTDTSYTEKVDNGHYESQTVQTGTKQVLDHYVCTGCGATK